MCVDEQQEFLSPWLYLVLECILGSWVTNTGHHWRLNVRTMTLLLSCYKTGNVWIQVWGNKPTLTTVLIRTLSAAASCDKVISAPATHGQQTRGRSRYRQLTSLLHTKVSECQREADPEWQLDPHQQTSFEGMTVVSHVELRDKATQVLLKLEPGQWEKKQQLMRSCRSGQWPDLTS